MWSTFHLGHYTPLTWMTLGLDFKLWGMQPGGYHLTSLLLHGVNAVLWYHLALRLLVLARVCRDTTSRRSVIQATDSTRRGCTAKSNAANTADTMVLPSFTDVVVPNTRASTRRRSAR